MSRRKWIQRRQPDGTSEMVEVDPFNYRPKLRSCDLTDRLISESHYEGVRATDGTPIDTRARHKRYMEEHGVCHAGDFSPEYYQNKRAEIAREDKRDRLQTVIEAVHRHEVL